MYINIYTLYTHFVCCCNTYETSLLHCHNVPLYTQRYTIAQNDTELEHSREHFNAALRAWALMQLNVTRVDLRKCMQCNIVLSSFVPSNRLFIWSYFWSFSFFFLSKISNDFIYLMTTLGFEMINSRRKCEMQYTDTGIEVNWSSFFTIKFFYFLTYVCFISFTLITPRLDPSIQNENLACTFLKLLKLHSNINSSARRIAIPLQTHYEIAP